MTEEPTLATTITPVDLTGVRDAGMRALVLLAASLGWNVLQRANNPIVITARDGTSKRLPTNTSIRMSVYQTALSTIMTHSVETVPTVELVDKIIDATKLDRDHARRMRIAIGESAQEHKQRLLAMAAGVGKAREAEEHLTQRIEMPVAAEPLAQEAAYETGKMAPEAVEFVDELPAEEPTRAWGDDWPDTPADDGDHGGIVSVEPFWAHRSGHGKTSKAYLSSTARERTWEDGYVDYTCVYCGKAHKSSRGVGSHFQFHYQNGEVPRPTEDAWRRTKGVRDDPDWEVKSVRTKPEPEEPQSSGIGDDAESILNAIIELVAPNMRRQRDEAVAALAELQDRYDKLDADWKALRDLITR
jgi:hypothetical protein